MRRNLRAGLDPIEHAIELALAPGTFIQDGACFSFVSGLEEVSAKIRDLIATNPARAIAHYEAFLAGCAAKADELDDSSGSFGQFAHDLICSWIEARQASGADPDQTVATLLAWMDDDPYAFCYEIERDAVKAFDKVGLSAFERQARKRFDEAAIATPVPGKPPGDQPEYIRRRWGDGLRTIYFAQGNISAYVDLTAETGRSGKDCCALAQLYVSHCKPDEALAWVERGLDLCHGASHEFTASYDLKKLQRDLLAQLGRGDDALDLAWEEFQQHPSKYTYDELMKFVPNGERPAWRERALDAATGADLPSLIELLIETGEKQRLADVIRRVPNTALEQVSHCATEPAAETLESTSPELAARLWRAQGFRIVDAKKSKYYAVALSNFARAKRCYERAGLVAEWEATVHRALSCHYRKIGFISGFKAVVAGRYSDVEPSFLDRAKARWEERYGRNTS
jgi:hypothetical protein